MPEKAPDAGDCAMDDTNTTSAAQTGHTAGFEALLWDLFLRLMDVPGDRLEAEFLDAQRRLCRALELDRSALWQTRVGSPGGLFVTHVYDAGHDSDQADSVDGSVARPEGSAFLLSDGAVVSKNADAATLFPWLTERIFAGETVVLPRVDDPPPGAERDLEVIRGFGTRSTVLVPLKAYGQILGCLSFATTRTARRWPGELVARFELVAQVFAKALARGQTEEQAPDCARRPQAAQGPTAAR